jgi:hypothetical protein
MFSKWPEFEPRCSQISVNIKLFITASCTLLSPHFPTSECLGLESKGFSKSGCLARGSFHLAGCPVRIAIQVARVASHSTDMVTKSRSLRQLQACSTHVGERSRAG